MSDVKKFFKRSTLFAFPLVVVLLLEAFVLPSDLFCFRFWEALKIKQAFRAVIPGYFYPYSSLEKVEEGDLGHHTIYGIPRKISVRIDEYGYRNNEMQADTCPVMVIGDSNIAGCGGIDQDEMFSVQLQHYLRQGVYAMAIANMNDFLADPRFKKKRPEVVIVESFEWLLDEMIPVHSKTEKTKHTRNKALQAAVRSADKLYTQKMVNFLRARLQNKRLSVYVAEDSTLFRFSRPTHEHIDSAAFNRLVEIVSGYKKACDALGVRFIFLPVPNKETIAYDKLRDVQRPVFIDRFTEALEARGIEVVKLRPAFDELYHSRGILPFFKDDTHWNPQGVKISADLTAQKILGKKMLSD